MVSEPGSDNKKIAVALSYDQESDNAPKIVAKGHNQMAEHIIMLAKQYNIHVHEDQDLAQLLSILDVESLIPIEAYAVVAEILSYVYQENQKYKESRNVRANKTT